MKTIEAKQKICPLNKERRIVELCPKWEFIKTRDTYVFQPENSCKCGEQTQSYKVCWECGDVATPEKAHLARTEEDYGELKYEEKEGKCTL